MSKNIKHYRTCNLCEAMCGIEIEADRNKVLAIRGDKADPFSRGHICPKALALKDIYEDKDRLKRPLKRTKQGWEAIEWEDAFIDIAQRFKAIQNQHGNNAIGFYLGNPNVHNLGSQLYLKGFIKAFKTKNVYSATSVDQLPHHLAGWSMFGNMSMMPVPDIDHTDYMIIMGGNPMVSNGSIMSVPDFGKRLKAIRQRGKVVVIDPRYTETAQKADEHLFIKPGTDVLLLMAMLQQMFEQGWIKLKHLEKLIDPKQVSALKDLSQSYTPESVSKITGIAVSTIKTLIKEFCEAEKAVLYGRLGVSVVEFGGLSQWLINCINILSGNFDTPGGAMLPTPAFDLVNGQNQRPKFGRWKSRVRGLPEFSGELPSATLAEEILTPGEGQIKAMITCAGNPILSTPNGQQLDKAFEELDFLVAIDIYINETTRHADYILPPATGLEVPHYDIAFNNLAIRNTAKYSPPLFDKGEQAKYDYEIFLALQKLMEQALSEEHPKSKAQQFYYHSTPEILLDLGLQSGPYELNVEKLSQYPHGIDLGPLKSQFPDRLATSEKTIDLFPSLYEKDMNRLEAFKNQSANDASLVLIGRRNLRSNNSWMHNSYRLVKGPKQCTLLIHPKDAARFKIENGKMVEVKSRVGKVSIEAELSEEIMPGVVSIPHGWGHQRAGVKMKTAQAHPGVSVNDLTDHTLIDELTGNAAVNGVPVEVSALV